MKRIGRQRLSIHEPIYWKIGPKRFCQYSVRKSWFWLILALILLADPILCSFPLTATNLSAQILLLACSTVLYFISAFGVATTEWDKIQAVKALGNFGLVFVPKRDRQLTLMEAKAFFFAEAEFLVELVGLMVGWCFIFSYPGLAVLRCLRLIRIFW
jgi:hypothetical protein